LHFRLPRLQEHDAQTVVYWLWKHIAGAWWKATSPWSANIFPRKWIARPLQSMPAEVSWIAFAGSEKVAGEKKSKPLESASRIIRKAVVRIPPTSIKPRDFHCSALSSALSGRAAGGGSPVNDADVMAAECCGAGKLHELKRVWTLGRRGVLAAILRAKESGRRALRLSSGSQENFCGCGGSGHLEGILGRRSMRFASWISKAGRVFEKPRARRCAAATSL